LSLSQYSGLTPFPPGGTNRKGKDKEKKDLSRQTTLFGLPSKPPAEKKKRPLNKGEGLEIGASDIEPRVPDMSEVPPPPEAATLVETQATGVTTEDTQPLEEEDVLIEWEASPPPSPR
jgi:chromosome transmission fidelity protein 4